ncbi:amyloid beta A4 precursor protein-binding family B member 1-interacting protein-like isoform X3 [Alosa pseudoharengus]|uniref:amyloid beta A4 precursor protein-binding family B member 1-interacting protein-like isoform X3 n=1 Tax=Alosa pseudoharengus TaxID=34774 RepID=UPI003F8BB88C
MVETDALFGDLLDEMDLLSQSIEAEAVLHQSSSETEAITSIGFNNLKESLHELEECDLDALVAGLTTELTMAEERLSLRCASPQPAQKNPASSGGLTSTPTSRFYLEVPSSQLSTQGHRPPLSEIEAIAQTKAEKIKMAFEKLKEAKIKKLIIKVLLSDGGSKTLMVDESQTTRDVLDCLFEKTHCDCSVDWSLWETNPLLQIERTFEDHECLVEHLSTWSRDTENQLHFLRRPEKYAVFRAPQMFYLWKKTETQVNEKEKQILIKESFQGPSASVPDLEGPLFLKERGKKAWKRRYFILRASGIYYVQKGKTKLSSDLACFVQFEHVNVYYSREYKHKYRAPTDFCFVLKHPQIQRESEYVRTLCCDDEHSLSLWVTSIRIAKYGLQLYRNYQAAEQRASGSLPGEGQIPPINTAGTTVPRVGIQCNGKNTVTPPTSQKNSISPVTTQSSSPIPPLLDDDLDEPPPDFIPPSPPGRRSKPNL